MNSRDYKMLYQLLIKRVVKGTELLEDFDISNRQLQYSVESINEELEMNQLPLIKKNNGYYYSKLNVSDYFSINQKAKDVYFPKEDRVQLIILMILTRKVPLNLDYFSIDLKVSKNTALAYVKKAKVYLEKNDLYLQFSRKEGYHILGDEWDKRIILFQSIIKIYKKYGKNVTGQMMEISQAYINAVEQDIITIENYLNVKYVDEEFYPLVHFIAAILLRINQGKFIETNRIHDKKDLKNTSTYQALNHLIIDFIGFSSDEKIFIALQLLSTNARDKNNLSDKELSSLKNALWEFLIEFETHTFLVLKDKKELLQKLVNHFRPAYYRIKYRILVKNVLYDQIQTEYRVLHNFVRESITALETFFQTKVADEEIAYITLFIGGHLIEKDSHDFESKITKTVILCPNGISMSNLIESNLKELFPEFLFYPAISIREYQDFHLPHDVVFSTVPIQSSKNVYVIDDILNKSDQVELRQHVMKDIFNLDFEWTSSQEIISLIKNYATISDEEELRKQLDTLLLKEEKISNKVVDSFPGDKQIAEFLYKDQIILSEQNLDWDTALKKLSNVLINKDIIQQDYQKILLQEYLDKPPYILIKNTIALPHLDPNLITQKLGVSLLLTEKGITYGNQVINTVILLTTPDKTSHLNLLHDIYNMASDKKFINDLLQLETKEKVIQMIKQYVNKNKKGQKQ